MMNPNSWGRFEMTMENRCEMSVEVTIREETPADMAAIADVTLAAFKDHPISRQTEPFIIAALRDAGALTLSLVAELDGRVVGHIAFSPLTISDGAAGWYGMGPVSVLPAYQRRGIGRKLVGEGLSRLKASGGQGCALVGDPKFYQRFGFRNYPDLVHEGVPQAVFLALPFGDEVPRGSVFFHDGFRAEGWPSLPAARPVLRRVMATLWGAAVNQ
jgi:putative acetyltransferase